MKKKKKKRKGIDWSKLRASMDRTMAAKAHAKTLRPRILEILEAIDPNATCRNRGMLWVRVQVTGGRKYNDEKTVDAVFGEIRTHVNISLLIEGGANGADRLCSNYAIENRIPAVRVEADWAATGRAAGHVRNTRMFRIEPHFLVAFPGGDGTADCVAQAESFNVPVIRVPARESTAGK